MMQLRRAVMIQRLWELGVYEAEDGRLLQQLTIEELEREEARAKDRLGCWSA